MEKNVKITMAHFNSHNSCFQKYCDSFENESQYFFFALF